MSHNRRIPHVHTGWTAHNMTQPNLSSLSHVLLLTTWPLPTRTWPSWTFIHICFPDCCPLYTWPYQTFIHICFPVYTWLSLTFIHMYSLRLLSIIHMAVLDIYPHVQSQTVVPRYIAVLDIHTHVYLNLIFGLLSIRYKSSLEINTHACLQCQTVVHQIHQTFIHMCILRLIFIRYSGTCTALDCCPCIRHSYTCAVSDSLDTSDIHTHVQSQTNQIHQTFIHMCSLRQLSCNSVSMNGQMIRNN